MVVSDNYQKVLKNLATNIRLPGFRKGKAPLEKAMAAVDVNKAWEKTFDKLFKLAAEFIDQDSQNEFNDVIGFAIENQIGTFDPAKNYCEIVLKYELKPTVELDQYDQIISPTPFDLQLTDDLLAKEIDQRLVKDIMLEPKETAAGPDDVVFFDFDGFFNDQPLKGGSAKNYQLDLANSNFIPGYAEELVGLAAGDNKTFTIKFPDNYHAKELKGADVVFKVTVHEVKSKKYPELNDEYVKSLNIPEVTTVEQYKTHVQAELTQKINEENEQVKVQSIYQWALMNPKNQLKTLPVKNLSHEAREKLKEQKQYINKVLANMGGFDAYIKQINKTEEQLLQELFGDLIKELHLETIFDLIAEKEQLTATDEESKALEPEIAKALSQNPSFAKLDKDDVVKKVALHRKVIDFLKSRVVYQPPAEAKPESNQ